MEILVGSGNFVFTCSFSVVIEQNINGSCEFNYTFNLNTSRHSDLEFLYC